jgi:hypothetical protein
VQGPAFDPQHCKTTKIRKKVGRGGHACNSRTWEAETGGSQAEASLSYIARSCLKKNQNQNNKSPAGTLKLV